MSVTVRFWSVTEFSSETVDMVAFEAIGFSILCDFSSSISSSDSGFGSAFSASTGGGGGACFLH